MHRLLVAFQILIFSTAYAREPAVAVVPIEGTGEVAGALTDALRAAVEAHPDRRMTKPVAMSLDEARVSFSCFDESAQCMAPLAKIFKAQHLVWGRVTDSAIELKALDVRQLKIRQARSRLPSGPVPAGAVLRIAEAFIDGQPLPMVERLVMLRIASTPPGAQVFVDGEPAGLTPLQVETRPGPRLIEARLGNRPPVTRQVLLGTESQTVDFQLAPPLADVVEAVPAAVDGTQQGRGTAFWLGVGAGGVAVVAASFGVVFGAQVVDLADEAESAEGVRRDELRDDFDARRLQANVSWVIAGLAAGTSAYLLITSTADDGVAVSASPGGLVLSGAF